ncbi:uncharacterized protein Z520_10012 [Fonsecaea multimorphosa CBS 102226]|uniref:Signal peptide peptidase n=1 Tax=Fonsecaea multimorphosa CBS 102226 TaxID=1442371 RepID=A0A0D2JLU8_9EURO|nr:uncharacterized protein Z520_10012 [Fonsecaea multimorphosa CBS 102226]KIX94302.1 hypothetical protein Z520_10012 [Fonsecaea multimorphosa CBS 102226]OAL19703.1 hypothetical protein AYO22_09509 [Fonsecaea multimorphosa]
MASEPGPLMEFLGQVAYHYESMRPLLPTYMHLLVSAIFPIYTAAHASLSRPPSAASKKSKKPAKDEAEESDDEDAHTRIESLTPSDAILFPILAGITLASLYFILKWLRDPAWLNWALGIYFSQIGLFFAMKFLKDGFSVMRSFVLPNEYSRSGMLWKVDQQQQCFKTENGLRNGSPFPGMVGQIPLPSSLAPLVWDLRAILYTKARLEFHVHELITVKTLVEILDLISLVLSGVIVYIHTFVSKPWFLTNILGFSFCYGSLQYMTPTTAWTGTLVLSALFFYDIYFVFFTPMMVTVATKLDVPIKLLFPRPDGCVFPVGAPEGSPAMEEYLQCLAKKRTMAMLGLGDIVVPGMMLAFALRFDLYLFYLRQVKKGQQTDGDTSKPTYTSATGCWGERFWTASKLWSKEMKAKRFPKTYLRATTLGYLAGMIVTVVVMQVAQHAQPALLYLVPGVLLSFWGTALVKGDLKELWRYNESPEIDDKKAKEAKEDKGLLASTRKDTIDDNAATNGAITSEDEGADPAKTQETKSANETQAAAKKDSEKACRRLIHFSITLPDPIHEAASTSLKSVTGDDRSERAVAAQDTAENQDSGRSSERKDDGEPPGKRARKS